MKKITFLIVLLTIFVSLNAQNYEDEFKEYFVQKDTLNMRKTLQNWEKAKPMESELFTSYLDYYFLIAHDEIQSLENIQPDGELIKPESSEKIAEYIAGHMSIRKPILSKGIRKIDEGINLYPDRLDMRFGEIFVLSQAKEWAVFTRKIIEAIDQSVKNKHKWRWTHNEKADDAENLFFSTLQDYQILLHNYQEDKLLIYMKEIATEVLKFYPDQVESLSNLSIVYMTNNQVDKAIEVLLRAETITRKDFIILSCLAYAYQQKGDKAKAIEYYQKTVRYGDNDSKRKAKEQIRELKK
ncbi:MAG: hypothetical protein WCK78_15820 [Paludibacter sp.]